jgi:hypothetical protein
VLYLYLYLCVYVYACICMCNVYERRSMIQTGSSVSESGTVQW